MSERMDHLCVPMGDSVKAIITGQKYQKHFPIGHEIEGRESYFGENDRFIPVNIVHNFDVWVLNCDYRVIEQ